MAYDDIAAKQYGRYAYQKFPGTSSLYKRALLEASAGFQEQEAQPPAAPRWALTRAQTMVMAHVNKYLDLLASFRGGLWQ